MSAFITARSSDGAIHLFADGAVLAASTGVLVRRQFKIWHFREGLYAFTYVGDNSLVGPILEAMCLLKGIWNIDLLHDRFVDLIDAAYRSVDSELDQTLQPIKKMVQFAMIGFSPSKQRLVSYVFSNYNHSDIDGEPWPFSSYETDCEVLPGDSPSLTIERAPRTWSAEKVRIWAVESINAMRAVTFDQYRGDGTKFHAIGFHVQHVSIAPDGTVTDEIIHEWPEDKIGHLIKVT